MKISVHELRGCLDIAAEFTRQYKEYVAPASGSRKSRDDLLHVAQELTGKEIDIYELDEPLEHETIYGYFVAEANGYSILLRTGLHEDVIRYVLCKELFHVMLDANTEYRTTDTCGHLDQVAISFPVTDSEPGPAVRSEVLAEIGAMEFLFPYTARIEELATTPVDFQTITDKYKIPQYLVERYLHPTYMAELGAMVPK
jgi:hypothetical protein